MTIHAITRSISGRSNHRGARPFAVAIVGAFVMCVGIAAPASAEHPDSERDQGPGAATVSPYAVPLAALDGRSLAKYISDHQAGDRRLSTPTTGRTTGSDTCSWTVDRLPRTPDAVEGWYHDC